LQRADGTSTQLPSKCDRVKVAAGDLLLYDTWGGGGCGDPLEREVDKVQFDVEAGLVTVAGALRYGVVISAGGKVDANATRELRARMAGERGAAKLFDRGFESIEELKGRCLVETGLAPPVQPQFSRRAAPKPTGKRAVTEA
jgi:N-methylhydantoinase B